MSQSLQQSLKECQDRIDRHMESYLSERSELGPGLAKLEEAVRYSALAGGKRFRPALSLFTAEALNQPQDKAVAYGLAVEMIHTYSLIHDDLPCMDNDVERRGKPTNHVVFGEDIALLAGDALLTEAFFAISSAYTDQPAQAVLAIRELSQAAGVRGMVGGQALDLWAQREKIPAEQLRTLHEMKTGALIEAAVLGAAHLCGASSKELKDLREFSKGLGLAFQVADDILDFSEGEEQELGNFATVIGLPATRTLLEELTEQALSSLASWGESAELLREVARFNRSREV